MSELPYTLPPYQHARPVTVRGKSYSVTTEDFGRMRLITLTPIKLRPSRWDKIKAEAIDWGIGFLLALLIFGTIVAVLISLPREAEPPAAAFYAEEVTGFETGF